MRRFMVHLAVIALLAMAFSEFAPIPDRADAVGFVPGTVPHYYGPYSNYANSPLKTSDAVLEFVGGGGNGASGIATVNPANGAITSVDITSGGSDYTSAPSVTVTSPIAGGTGASLTTAISKGVTEVTLTNPGHGYTAEPTVTVNGDGTGAVLDPFMSGFVASIEVGLPGGSYVTPVVTIGAPDEPGGVQATATATVANGGITGVTITNHGSGYTTDPDIFITDGNGNGDGAAARAIMQMDTISALQIRETGRNYTSATISISAPNVAGTQATATATVSGAVVAINVVSGGTGYVTPGGIKKFVDTLPGFGEANKNNLGQYIPVAVPDTTTYPGTDYYEIGLVQYREKMHTDIPATLLRGYVQLSTSVVPGKKVALTNANLNPALPSTPITLNGVQVQGVDNPHQYGPFIMATKDRPVRVLFRNLLPTGTAGDLFIPVDTTVMGSGMGPTGAGMVEADPLRPMCGETPKPVFCYTENRATLHLHGGITPWISDGTPHQWITPAGESTVYPKGVSVSNVPDMPDPGPGAQTFFYTNQQSARLLFYHDHSSGITRLNVYAGEAAGYLITDATEQKLIANGTLPSTQIPLILSDKTFVPNDEQMLATDPTWNKAKWGGEGSLWMPHVYMPIQNPTQSSGTNDFGRWAYGPWFWPPTTGISHGPIDNPYYNASCDTDVEPFCEPKLIPGTPVVSMGMESFNDTPLVNGTAYPTVTFQPKAYRFRVLNASDDRYFNLSLYQADATGTEVALKADEVAAAKLDPNVAPTPDTTKSPQGPNFIQVGTEGGFLPSPVIVPNQPISYVTDPARFDVGNVDQHSLYVGPAERYDVVVDFSKWAGKTLILYNDAPAANPARDARYDYYTDNGDLTAIGGAPTTLPGYGPNTRTVMQIKVAAAAPALAYNYGRLVAAFAHHVDGSGVFESSQAPIVVGQGAYNAAYGTNFRFTAPFDGYARMTDGSLTFKTLANGAGGAALTIPLEMKAMHDEQGAAFDPEYGRMSGMMGLEDPLALTGAQNVYLYPYINPSTENFNGIELPPGVSVTPISRADDGTQIWKITHNGVDTHAMHWHLYDVQVINRVGWDGIIRPPGEHELGWKDTVKVAPLEDTIVAMRPIIPKLPFAVPDSVRVPDPTMPEGAILNNVNTGAPTGMQAWSQVNAKVNMGWEYVWHCHLLSHEEMDMMRPQEVAVEVAVPNAPTMSAWNGTTMFSWTDPTPAATIAAWGDTHNEIGFRLERARVVNGVVSPYTVVANALANHTSAEDATVVGGVPYRYRVVAYNTAGEKASATINVTFPVYTLSGRVTAGGNGLNGATVNVYSATTGTSITSVTTATANNVSGSYSFSLMPGTYKLYVQPNTAGYNNQWYGGADQTAATTITLSANTQQNIALTGAPVIKLTGTLTFTGGSANGQVAANARVSIYDALTGRSLFTVTTNGQGVYTQNLSAGTYKVYIQPQRQGYANQWFGGANQAAATQITVAAAVTQNISVHV